MPTHLLGSTGLLHGKQTAKNVNPLRRLWQLQFQIALAHTPQVTGNGKDPELCKLSGIIRDIHAEKMLIRIVSGSQRFPKYDQWLDVLT